MRTRFAPSPSGYLHLGHAFSALEAWEVANEGRDQFLLRIEDIDTTRCHKKFEDAIYEDLQWLGLEWTSPVMIQSERLPQYAAALDILRDQNVVYPCFCTRKEIQQEIDRAANAPHGPDGALYPGTCKSLSSEDCGGRIADGIPHAWRLNVEEAMNRKGKLTWRDRVHGNQEAKPELYGDVVVARKDIGTSYHLSVVVDDAAQGIEVVTRGDDLFHATHVHRLLQELLELPVPEWHHHGLINDTTGLRLAKRNDSKAIRGYRESGRSVSEVLAMIHR